MVLMMYDVSMMLVAEIDSSTYGTCGTDHDETSAVLQRIPDVPDPTGWGLVKETPTSILDTASGPPTPQRAEGR